MSIVSNFLDEIEQEEEITLEEEEKLDEIDDWIAEAQDAFFDGDYEKAIQWSEKVLNENESELDAKDILLMSLFSKSPPSFQSILDYQSKWRDNNKNNDNLKDAFLELRASYLLNDSGRVFQSSKIILSLLSQSTQPLLFNISLTVAFLSELSYHDLAQQFLEMLLPFYQGSNIPSDDQTSEIEEWMKIRGLIEWAMACDSKLKVESLPAVSNPSNFLSCVRMLIALEKEEDRDKAVRLWNDLSELSKRKDIHAEAVSQLLDLPSSFSFSSVHRLNDIFRKRLMKLEA